MSGPVLVVAGLGVLISAVAVAAETALNYMSRARAEALAEAGRPGAERLTRVLERPETTIPALTVVAVAAQASAVAAVAVDVADGGPVALAAGVGATATVVALFGVIVPRTAALASLERAAILAAPLAAAARALPPLRALTWLLVRLARALVPGATRVGPVVSEEELLELAEAAAEAEVIEATEQALIESIIEFGDTVVREVMVPRTDMVTIQADFRVADALEVVILNGFSRIPVYDEGIDDIIGIVYAKDIMRAERDGRHDEPVRTLVREARFVPESKPISDLMREMQAQKFHMAVVIDEYGGTAGLVTLEDLIEELVGEIVDEFDVDEPLMEPLADGSLRVNARMPVSELNELLDHPLPEGDWDSVGGLLYHHLGRIPVEGEVVTVDGWRLVVERVQGRRIARIRLHPGNREVPAPSDGVAADAREGSA